MGAFLTKKTIFGVVLLLILVAGLGGGVYLSQRQTDLTPSADDGDSQDYCSAGRCSPDCIAFMGQGSCPTSGGGSSSGGGGSSSGGSSSGGSPALTCAQGNCSACTAGNNACGQHSYDTCDYATACKNGGTTYKCYASQNPNGCSFSEYPCSACPASITGANPGAGSGGTSSGGSTDASGSLSGNKTTINKLSNGNWDSITLSVTARNVPSGVGIYFTNDSCSSASQCEGTGGWTQLDTIGGAVNSYPFTWTAPNWQVEPGAHTFAVWELDNGSAAKVLAVLPVTYGSGGGSSGSGGTGGTCNPGETQYNQCRSCNAQGQWILDYGPKDTSSGSQWCACAVTNSGAAYAQSQGCNVSSTPSGGSCSAGNYGDPNNKQAWCACAKQLGDMGSYNRGPKEDGSSGSCQACTPNAFDATACTTCASDGSAWGTPGSSYGPNVNSAEWCSCAQRKAPDYATSGTYATCRTSTTSGNPGDQAECLTPQPNFLDAKTLNPVQGSLIENTDYKVRVIMKNTNNFGTTPNPTTWKQGTYKLIPSEQTKTTWLAQEAQLTRDVAPGGEAIFTIPVKTPAAPNGAAQEVGYYFQMSNNGALFGGACEPQVIKIDPAGPGAVATGTACFVMSESLTDVNGVTSCDNEEAKAKGIIHQYTGDPTTVPYTLQGDPEPIVGIKTVYVRFISASGQIKDINKQIRFSPGPVLDVIACTHSATGQGTLVGIRGQNFGEHKQQGQGYVKINGQNAAITSWDATRNIVIGTVPTRLEGEQAVELKLDDGRIVQGRCNVGISTVDFTVNTQCTLPGTLNAENVEVRVQEATSGAKPLVSQKIRINKGLPQDFAPKVETGKKYSLIIKAPGTLSRKIDFVADEGTKNLGEIKLFIGDIAPRLAPDGKINTVDKSEMARQWSLLEVTSERTADLNKDSVVNSHDYSCQKLGFNQQDEVSLTTSQSN